MPPHQSTILAVDDDPTNIEQIHNALKSEYQIRAATNGDTALKAVIIPPLPDLVILDIMMPGIDGYEVCRRLKARPLTRDIPVIFLTAKSEEEDEARGFQEGAVDYIHKPISPPILQARVRTQLALKQAHDLLQRQNEVLENLVRQRTEELAGALKRSLAAGKAKTAFLQTMSHELRTPLNHILGYAEMLEEELADQPEQLQDLGRIRSSGRHLLEMIAGVLEYAHNEGAEDLVCEPVQVSRIIQRAVQDCEDRIRKSNNHIESQSQQDEINARTDPARLQRLVTELIRNAAKFTNGGRITVSTRIETGKNKDQVIIVEVSDTGIGMTPEQIQHCFDAFWQADGSISRTYGGTGMGLASAKQLALQLGAELNATSEPGKGSTFQLRLPAASF